MLRSESPLRKPGGQSKGCRVEQQWAKHAGHIGDQRRCVGIPDQPRIGIRPYVVAPARSIGGISDCKVVAGGDRGESRDLPASENRIHRVQRYLRQIKHVTNVEDMALIEVGTGSGDARVCLPVTTPDSSEVAVSTAPATLPFTVTVVCV